MIIGLIGQKRVGKDTVATIIQKYDNEYKCMALADPIKDIARIMFNFSEKQLFEKEKDEIDNKWNIKPRQFFEQFGTDIMQFDIYKYLPTLEAIVPQRKFWIKSLLSKIKENDKVIITDIREQHELDEILKFNHNTKFIRIRSIRSMQLPELLSDSLSTIAPHLTQQEPNEIMDEYIVATIDNNSSIDDLQKKVKDILTKIF